MPGSGDKHDPLRFGTESPEQYADLHEAVNQRTREPGFLVALGRQATPPTQESVAAFAKALGLDTYTARQRLLAPTPRILRREDRASKAKEWVDWFRELGLRAFDFSEEMMAAQSFAALSGIYEQQGGLVFDLVEGERVEVQHSEVIAVVYGETSERVDKFQSHSGAMVGELAGKKENLSITTEAYIDIHRRTSPVSLRVAQDEFNWKSLYPDRIGQSTVLMRELLNKITTSSPTAIVYNDFARVEGILGHSEQIIEQSRYLIRNWYPMVVGPVSKETEVRKSSNRSAYQIYTTLARLETMRA